MPALTLDGTRIAQEIRSEVAAEAKSMAAAGVRPGLAVVLVGHNPASEIYVRGKVKACEEVGVYSEKLTPPESVSTAELLALIEDLNRRDEIDGILVQLPLPPQVDSKKVLLAVDPAKDVDGFHPMNVGFLSTQRPGLVPCTPAGVIEILKRSHIPISGREAVVVGRSDIVGKPAAMLLINGNATVTICHSKTHDLPAVCRRADILVAAIGRAGMITRDFVKPGATVIDVGMNTVTDPRGVPEIFRRKCQEGRNISQEGIDADRRCASGGSRSSGSAHACPRRRWAAHDCDAHVQHAQSREDAAGKPRTRIVSRVKSTTETRSHRVENREYTRIRFSLRLCASVVKKGRGIDAESRPHRRHCRREVCGWRDVRGMWGRMWCRQTASRIP